MISFLEGIPTTILASLCVLTSIGIVVELAVLAKMKKSG